MMDDWTQGEGFEPSDMIVREMDLCFCDRDPASAEVRKDMAKVMTLNLRYGLVLSGCLGDAAAAFDNIFAALLPTEARELEHLLVDIEGGLDWAEADTFLSAESEANGVQVH